MEEEEKPDINLRKYKTHQKKFPWALIRKIVIACTTIGLMYYFINQSKKTQEPPVNNQVDSTEVEVDVEL